jgi:hypothetical protein
MDGTRWPLDFGVTLRPTIPMNANTTFEIFIVDCKGQSASLAMLQDDYLQTLREFIDFVNHQVGVYMGALAGFAGNKTRIEF